MEQVPSPQMQLLILVIYYNWDNPPVHPLELGKYTEYFILPAGGLRVTMLIS